MTVGNNDTYAIATHSDWLNRLAPIFQPLRGKTKTIAPYTRDFSRVLSKLQLILGFLLVPRTVCSSYDW